MNKRRKLRDMLEYESLTDEEETGTAAQQRQADAWLADLPSDTMAAVLLFKGMMTRDKIATRAVVLKAHVYSVVTNRTTVDREFDQLRLSRKIRMLKVPSDLDDFAVMLWSDYEDTVNDAIASTTATAATTASSAAGDQAASSVAGNAACASSSSSGNGHAIISSTTTRAAAPVTCASPSAATRTSRPAPPEPKQALILRHFRDVVLPACLDMVVTKHMLALLLRQAPADPHPPSPAAPPPPRAGRDPPPGPSPPPAGRDPPPGPSPPPAAPRAVSMLGRASLDEYSGALMAAGFLTRDPVRADTLRFCVPGLGAMLQQVRAGREELLAWLRRRRYREASQKDILALRLRSSRLGAAFHIRDLLGVGAVVQLKTTTGAVYKVAVHRG